MRNSKILLCIIILIGIIMPNSVLAGTPNSNTLQIEGALDGFQMINLFSHGVSATTDLGIISHYLEPHGLITHNVAPENPVSDVFNNTFSDIDYLCTEIDVTDYHVLVVCDECNITLYSSAMSLILEAYNEGLIIVGIGGAGLLFAELDIINGKNITCTWDGGASQTIIENAGATYKNPLYGPYVDLPFITASVNYENLYSFVALALGVDLATITPTPTDTSPTSTADIPISNLVFIVCLIFASILYKKKRN